MTTEERVANLLLKKPELRDNDDRLIANYWHAESKKYNPQTAEDLLTLVAQGKLTSGPTIKRTRARLQKHNPHLRGKLYTKRQAHSKTLAREIVEPIYIR